MRILNLQAQSFVQSFRRLGHQVLSIGTEPGCDIRPRTTMSLADLQDLLRSKNFVPDLIFWCDNCQPPLVVGVEYLPSIIVGFSIDQYCNPWHVPFSAAFDHLLLAQKDYLRLFQIQELERPLEWFPLYCDPARDRDQGLERDVPVGFVGTLEGRFNRERKPFLHAFRNGAPLFVTSGDYVPVFNRCRIVLNQSAAGELNYRLFQSMACGTVCLTEDTGNGLRDLFVPEREVLLYPRGDATAAARIALEWLQSPELAEVAAAGQKKVLLRHTVERRARRVLRLAATLLEDGAHRKRLANMERVQWHMRNVWHFLATDETLPLSPEHRRFYQQLGLR